MNSYDRQILALRGRMNSTVKGGLIALAVVVVLGIVAFAIWDHNRWQRWCEAQGGRVDSHTSWTTVHGSDGTSSSNSDTTYYCLNSDGGIIDIR